MKLLRYSLLALIIFLGFYTIVASSNVGNPLIKVAPPGGTYPDAITVTFINMYFNEGDRVYYTLDGDEPSEYCLEYSEGDIILIDKTTILKYVVYKHGYIPGEVLTETYQILNGGDSGDGTTLGNEAMVNAWYEYESATRQRFMDKYFGGCEPVIRCNSGLNMQDMGIWTLCENETITNKAACEAAGHGWITWEIAQEGFGGYSAFEYNGYTYTLDEGCDLTAESGKIIGHFDSQGTGYTTTGEGATVQLTGCYNGSIDDSTTATLRVKSGGFYEVTCSDTGCSPNTEIYLVSSGPVFTLFDQSSSESSCTAPYSQYYVIRNQWNDRCLQGITDYTGVAHLTCTGYTAQRWSVVKDASDNSYYKIISDGSDKCLTIDTSDLLGFYYPIIATCTIGDDSQRFTFEGTGEQVQIKPHIQLPNNSWPCVTADLVQANNKVWSWYNCSGEAPKYGFFLDGAFPAVDPAGF